MYVSGNIFILRMLSVGLMMIFSEVTASARRNAFSSRPTMRLVAALPASSLLRSFQLRWFILSMMLEPVRTTF